MVEDVKVFPPEFESVVFLERETFEEAEVEIQPAGEPQRVASRVSDGETDWQRIGIWIVVKNTEYACGGISLSLGLSDTIGIADDVREGEHCATDAAGQSGIVSVGDRKSTRLNSSHQIISYAVFCLKKKKHPHPPHSPRRPAIFPMRPCEYRSLPHQ